MMPEELIEIHAVIAFLWEKWLNSKTIHEEILSIYRENAMTLLWVHILFFCFSIKNAM